MAEVPTVGVIDCGTNSTRLLVCDGAGRTLERRMVITRLGDGVDQHRRLSEAALERTLAVLDDYAGVMARHGVRRRRAVATSAARDADNREAFFDRAQAILGIRPELISGDEEGRLSYAGATADLSLPEGPVVVVDIGGGSTEVVVGGTAGIGAVSLDIGCVRVSERFLAGDPPRGEELATAAAYIDELLTQGANRVGAGPGPACLIGLAGTVSTAAMIDAGLAEYDRDVVHHYRLATPRVEAMLGRLAGLERAERAQVRGLEAGRVDVIVGGLLVLQRVLNFFAVDHCLVSEADILDGMASALQAPA